MNIIRKISAKISWLLADLYWILSKPKIAGSTENDKFCIGITTFMDRFESCLKKLLPRISALFPGAQIIVVANGHYRERDQIIYLTNLTSFCERFQNVYLIKHIKPKGLSLLWNSIIMESKFPNILILNDDVKIRKGFRSFIISKILGNAVTTINGSWSHFLITKEVISQTGYFDEGLAELGGEDDDYSARLAIEGIRISDHRSGTVSSLNRKKLRKLKINSFGKNIHEQEGGYSTLNTRYLNRKWEFSDTYFEGAAYVPNRMRKYWKLRGKN